MSGALRFLIILYLLIPGTFTFLQSYGWLPDQSAALMDDTALAATSTTQAQAQAFQASDKSTLDLLQFTKSYLGNVANFAMFSFEIGGAPPAVNSFLALLFGILSWIFLGALVGKLASLIPFTG